MLARSRLQAQQAPEGAGRRGVDALGGELPLAHHRHGLASKRALRRGVRAGGGRRQHLLGAAAQHLKLDAADGRGILCRRLLLLDL